MKTINGIEIMAKFFAFDNCHKIYLLNDEQDTQEAKKCGYDVIPIAFLKAAYRGSCYLRFISDWKLTTQYAAQGEVAKFGGRWGDEN